MVQSSTRYAVQLVSPNEDIVIESSRVSVDAPSAASAAEMIAKTRLVNSGPSSRLRARVWHVTDDFRTVCTDFYLPAPPTETGTGFSRIQWLIFVLICLAFVLINAALFHFAAMRG